MRALLILLYLCGSSEAAYRAYKLKVQQLDASGRVKKTEVVSSTLDPYQYEHYHSGYKWMRVTLMDSWYCPGDTSGKKMCEKPREPQRIPASMEREKRLPISRQPVIP